MWESPPIWSLPYVMNDDLDELIQQSQLRVLNTVHDENGSCSNVHLASRFPYN